MLDPGQDDTVYKVYGGRMQLLRVPRGGGRKQSGPHTAEQVTVIPPPLTKLISSLQKLAGFPVVTAGAATGLRDWLGEERHLLDNRKGLEVLEARSVCRMCTLQSVLSCTPHELTV